MNQREASWSPHSWHDHPIVQQPDYSDKQRLQKTLSELQKLPPLVGPDEVEHLKAHFAKAARGEAFILQGGDCGERFADCTREMIASKLRILKQMAIILCNRSHMPVVKVGRIAGQYAKPRSSPYEIIGGQSFAVYRGDFVNQEDADHDKRRADPERLKLGYFHAATTLNYMRWLAHCEPNSLQDHDRMLADDPSSPLAEIAAELSQSDEYERPSGAEPDFFTSHEGLLLPYEATQTRYVAGRNAWYNLGAHMLWIGDRTRDQGGAHIEYFRGIANPVGIKVGPGADPRDICLIMQRLNPDNVPGKTALITRYGSRQVQSQLSALLEAVQSARLQTVWLCDPMHGNTIKTSTGLKTRIFDDIVNEIHETIQVHRAAGSRMAGLHLELSGEKVTECVGGFTRLSAEQLATNYKTCCDPRLNSDQGLELALRVGQMLQPASMQLH
ncbi:3-deoxy-7-phosphoheptulonate synthase class II [Oligoflexus tunisiensis]|uniref:3-deoxy-7-phosphoheptulonate synthase class II n=1 Tax=Oligoflexus tunisiensis TaxID=708132 RepID=UPI000A649627|nr:3-deoxy-7-phosphoheptulonate synthase class II [Oligoflexus tunisiensis]